MLLVPLPWATRGWALPVLSALAPSAREAQERGRRHQSLGTWARQLLRRVHRHKEALKLVRANDTIYHEDVQTANMLKNHRLAKSISDAGWGAFLAILSFKAACAGRRVVAVPPAYTSQRCSGPRCGALVLKGLSVRWHSCPECGTSLHRDHNAARNILRLGVAQKKGPGMALRGGVAMAASENRESAGL